jgi:peptidoglycan/LPS O-acetylase OafA/YrhL
VERLPPESSAATRVSVLAVASGNTGAVSETKTTEAAATATALSRSVDEDSGAESAEAPGPAARKFRPDVEGLRAIAVLLVVLVHAGVPHVTGGYVGVDVFFVISGYLITGLLVNEREQRGSISIVGFYGRRVRRILPAATLLIVAVIFAGYIWLGFLQGNSTADDGRWAAVFLANLHFGWTGTQYFNASAQPSPLQHMWSLGVEEQFYVVWPTLVLVIGLLARTVSLRLRLAVTLGVIIAASLAWSIIETNQNGTWAYFSPLTRAWELALGGLVAVASPLLPRFSKRTAIVAGSAGMVAILVSSFVFTSLTLYPGIAAALPVGGAALVIAAGAAMPNVGVERVLAWKPFQWLGARSYSWYLWHWPFIIVPAEYWGKIANGDSSLPAWENLAFAGGALVVAAISYALVENPIRHAKYLAKRPWLTVAIGAAMILVTLAVAQVAIHAHSGPNGLRPIPSHTVWHLSEGMSAAK